MSRRKTSPLQAEDRKKFDHLRYFDVDPSWKVIADYQKLDGMDTVDFSTSSGRIKRYVRYAQLSFERNGKQQVLYAYKRVYPDGHVPGRPYLFIPFTDLTTGEATYGGGRYMDIDLPAEGTNAVELDFNLCYNPYCAYGSGFSCPIPPRENFLNLRVEAGEKDYGSH